MALFRKFFYRKPPDGLLEISERVYVFDCCFTTDVLEDENYKVYMGNIASQLREHFPDASFMVFNFRDGDHQSQIFSILSEYEMTVMDYPRHYEGCPLLTMEVIHHFLRSCENWLSLGQQNVLLMHCERSGWPILAFMLAALLIYRKQYTAEQKTLEMIYKQAPRELLHLMSPLNPLPSQLRYLQYVSRRNVASEWPPLDRALTLDCIILRVIPILDGEGGFRPIFRIYGQDPFMVADRTPKVLFSTPKRSKAVRHYKQEDCELVKIDIHCHIQGDVVLECISLDEDMEREEMMFRVMFNTAFIRSNILMLNRDEIDILWNSKDQFPNDFRAEVLFSEMDSGTSLITIDLQGVEEKEGLPMEAFAKVQEIFNNVDWLDPKADVALNVLQKITTSNILQELEIDSAQSEETVDLLQECSPEKVEEKPKPKAAENNISSITSMDLGNQRMTLAKKSAAANLMRRKIDNQELQVALQRPAQSKIISQRIPQSPISNPVSNSNSLQGSPVPISRYHSAPSALGITALLQDHAAPMGQEKTQLVAVSSLSPAISFPVSRVIKPLQSRIVSIPPAPPPPPSLKPSLATPTRLTKISAAPPPPPPPLPCASDQPPLIPPASKPTHSLLTKQPGASLQGRHQSLVVMPPQPPPLPRSFSGEWQSSTLKNSISPSPPPPPPPPLPSLCSSGISTSTTVNNSFSTLASPPLPPPPPPPPPPPHCGVTPSASFSLSSSLPLHAKNSVVPFGPPLPPPLPPPPPSPSCSRPASSPNITSTVPPCPPSPGFMPKDFGSDNFLHAPPPPPPPFSNAPPPPLPLSSNAPPPPPPPSNAPPPPPAPFSNAPPPPPAPFSKAPPPPPAPFSNAPPPPPAFGAQNASSNGNIPPIPGPPALFGGKDQGLSRAGPKNQAQPKRASLKPYHWLKLTRAMQGSLWAETQQPEEASKAPEFDMSELESLFSAAVPSKENGGGKSNRRASGPKSEKVQLFPITAIREIKILKKLHHENVIKLKEIVTSPGPEKDDQGRPDGNKYKGGIYMVFEYMDHDLTGLADRPGMRFSVPQIKCYMRQLLTGLHYCHVNQVLHRDIKGSNLLIDNEGNLKLADFGLARSFSNDHNGNLTNRVITLWYRPPELLLGTTRYGPAVDMWSVGCIFAELLHGKPIFPGKDEPEQLNKIFELCGAPDEVNWPGVSKIPWYSNFKPTRPMKRRLREVFRHFDRHALELLERMLTLDPSQRISAKDALDAEYFWTDPLPCDPKSLPKYESSHEFQTKKKRQQQRQHDETAKRQKLQHPQQHTRLPPIQQSGQVHAQMRAGPNPPMHGSQPTVAAGPSHHYGKPRGPSGGPSRYPQSGNPSGGYNHPNRGGQGGGGGGYGNGPFPPQGRGPPYASSGMPSAGPRGGGSGYGVGAPNYPQGGPYSGSGAGRGSNMMGGNRNQNYGWQQ